MLQCSSHKNISPADAVPARDSGAHTQRAGLRIVT
jgi:hypothetical protein